MQINLITEMSYRLPPEEFDEVVARAVADLPEEYLARLELENIDIVVEPEPTPEQLAELGLQRYESLFGLYEGVSLPERMRYGEVLPDKITIFQRPIESYVNSMQELEEQIQTTVKHEVAHFFGFDDDEIDDMGIG